jgi:hypothetical protein
VVCGGSCLARGLWREQQPAVEGVVTCGASCRAPSHRGCLVAWAPSPGSLTAGRWLVTRDSDAGRGDRRGQSGQPAGAAATDRPPTGLGWRGVRHSGELGAWEAGMALWPGDWRGELGEAKPQRAGGRTAARRRRRLGVTG